MNQLFLTILASISMIQLYSQNLVQNHTFEVVEEGKVKNWEKIAGTPDLIEWEAGGQNFLQMANRNFFTNQPSKKMMGFAFSSAFSEVFGTELIAPLIKDSTYQLTVRLLTGHGCRSGLEKLTIGLTNEPLKVFPAPRNYELDVHELSTVSDFIPGEKWLELSLQFKAKGGEQYLSLGNFNGANEAYSKTAEELLIDESASSSCNYLIIDEVELVAAAKIPNLRDEPLIIEDVAFSFGEWEIKAGYQETLGQMVEILTATEGHIIITGYTDDVGGTDYNLHLSLKRAQSIKDFLIAQGIDSNRMSTFGKGEANPRYDNGTAIGRKQNRRVEIWVE